jgi:DNA polymerase-3 subunit delta
VQLEGGRSPGDAAAAAFPRLHFSRKDVVESALRNLTPARLVSAIEQLAVAARDARKYPPLADEVAQRALMAIAVNARRRG